MATAAAAKDDQPARRFAKDQLKAFVERVERLEEEKKAIAEDIRDVYADATALMSKLCASSCDCANRTSTSGKSRRLFSRLICTRSGCWDSCR